MIAYKWVIKNEDKYYPIINNGAFFRFDNLNLSFYEKGKTVKNFINPYILANKFESNQHGFNRMGYHFWTEPKNNAFNRYQRCMKRLNKQINCILKCYIREKDIILKDKERIISKKFRILGEIKWI